MTHPQVLQLPANGIPESIPGQVKEAQRERIRPLDRWMVRLCANVGAELRGNAHELLESPIPSKRQQGTTNLDRANLWLDLAERIASRTAGNPAAFDAADVELIRWFRLVQLRQLTGGSPAVFKARCKELDALFHAVYATLLPFELSKVDARMLP